VADQPVRSLIRGLAVLRGISNRGSATLAELHADTGISRPALLRLLGTLEAEGYARRWLTDGRYRISFNAPEIVKTFDLAAIVADVVGPTLQDLLEQISWPADVAVRDGYNMVLCETTRRQSPQMIHQRNAGYRVHMLQSAVGRAFLAFCQPDVRDEILAVLQASNDPNDRLARAEGAVDSLLNDARVLGYAFREKGYLATRPDLPLQFSAIAAPIMIEGRVIACISVTWIATALSEPEFVFRHLAAVKAAALRSEKALAACHFDFDAIAHR
jgi:IclR family mhp operon transcriptional activator